MKRNTSIIISIGALLFISALFIFLQKTQNTAPQKHLREVILSSARENHILSGDVKGGGHRYGANKPCKSEFPKSWSDSYILNTVKTIAANDNLDWDQQRNGYYTAEDMIGAIRVRVVLAEDQQRIITAYPVNVQRNPCPAAANDNKP